MTSRRLKFILALQAFCILLLALVTAWWGRLLVLQADRLHTLDPAANSHRTISMVLWEGGALVVLIVILAAVSGWFIVRDLRRSRQTEALFASFTHELKTPLTSIRLQAETIADTLPVAESQRSLITRLLEDTARLETQVDRSLELARVVGGGGLNLEALPLKSQIENALSNWQSLGTKTIHVDLSIGPEWVLADRMALRTVFRNLLENSQRHSEKSSIRATVRAETKGQGRVCLSYEDTGSPFRGNARHLGQLFYKGPASMGTGVGLFLIRTLMTQMGGRATFTPSPAGFHVDLEFQEAAHG